MQPAPARQQRRAGAEKVKKAAAGRFFEEDAARLRARAGRHWRPARTLAG